MARAIAIVVIAAVFSLLGTAQAGIETAVVRVPVVLEDDQTLEVTVFSGDHLWKISADHLKDRDPTRAVAPYWRRVVDWNTPRLRSGDPDLIYPGEVVELPALSEQP